LDFNPGLNVLIGPRGAGKTSVIELIRFCLGAEAYTPANDRAAKDHALSILRGGQCVLTVEVDGVAYELARSAEDDAPRIPAGNGAPPIILSQNEIERVGLDARGRIRLVDDFLSQDRGKIDEGRLQADIASLTQKIQSEAEGIARLDEEILRYGPLESDLAAAEKEQDEILEGFSQLEPQREELASIDSELLILSGREGVLSEADENISALLRVLTAAKSETADLIPEWPAEDKGEDELKSARRTVESISERLAAIQDDGEDAQKEIHKKLQALNTKHKSARDRSRTLRSNLDEVQSGAGEITRRVTQLREQLNSREAAKKKVKTASEALEKQQAKRKSLLKKLDGLREQRFNARQRVATSLNEGLSPQVKVGVSRYGVLDHYAAAIASAMQGSRLRYNTLAPEIAERMTPTELVEAVERGKADTIAKAVKISEDRAEKIIEVLRGDGSEGILRAEVEDAVEISLLDGPDYKMSPDLSTGQRCTAVLPILLSHSDRVLVMDQPEDHLDNAYVADTVVRTLRDAPSDAQLIISTHNANIPVLGEADVVTHLESDGRRGFIKSCAPLDDPETVSAITRVMEGGEEAFRLRAQFYHEHDGEE